MFYPLNHRNNIPEDLEEVHGNANRVKSRGLVLSVKPERFRLPFVSNTSIPVILENKNNYPISYSVDTTSPMCLTIDPKDGCVEPGQEAHIIIRRPSRISVTQNEEHLVFRVKSCNGCNYDKERNPGRKMKPTDSLVQGESIRRGQLSKLCCDSKQRTFSTGRSQGSRYCDEENLNCYDKEYAQTGSHFVDYYESNRGRHKKRDVHGFHKKTPEDMNRLTWSSSVPPCSGSKVANNNQSNKNRSSQFFLTTGPEFKGNIDSNRNFQSKGVPKAPKPVKDCDIGRHKSKNTFVSTGSKCRDDNNSNWENYQASKSVDQSQRHIYQKSEFKESGVPKTHKLDQNGERSRYNHTLVSTGQKFSKDNDSHRENYRCHKFAEQNQRYRRAHIDVESNLANENSSRHLYKSSHHIHAASNINNRDDSNQAIRVSVGTSNELKTDELGNGVERKRSKALGRPNISTESKYDDNSRADGVYSRNQYRYSEKQPDGISYHKKYPSYQYENYINDLPNDVKSVNGDDVDLTSDKELRSFDWEGFNLEQKEVDEKTVEKPRSDSMFRKMMRRMTNIVVPFSKKSNKNEIDEKPLVTDEKQCCECCCITKHSREGTTLKIKIKNEKEAAARVLDIPFVEKYTFTNKKVLSYILLISIFTTVAVLATCFQGTFVIPYYTQVKPSFWELLKQ